MDWNEYKASFTNKKKKKYGESLDWDEYKASKNNSNDDTSGLFKRSEGNLLQTIGGTVADLGISGVKGAIGGVEDAADLVRYGFAGLNDLIGRNERADYWRSEAMENSIDDEFAPIKDKIEKYSVSGDTLDNVAGAVGYIASLKGAGKFGQMAGLGEKGVGNLVKGALFTSGMGSGMTEAYHGNATDGEALTYGALKGGTSVIVEGLVGGLGKSLKVKGLSDGKVDKYISKFADMITKNTTLKNTITTVSGALGEGVEEVTEGFANAFAKKFTYMSEEDIWDIMKDEKLGEQFWIGTFASAVSQMPSYVSANKSGVDLETGYTKNEQQLHDAILKERLDAVEGTLTNKDKANIEESVKNDLKKGNIDIDTIEKVLGGDTYNSYKSISAEMDEYNALNKIKGADLTGEQSDRLAELKKNNSEYSYKDRVDSLKRHLSKEVYDKTQSDAFIRESYNEKARRGQKYTADVSKYDVKHQETIQRAIDSGILNNTNRTHEFVDMIAKVSADKGVSFNFTDNQKLKESGFALDGRTVNGFVEGKDITLNVNSAKALNKVVGHEITHVLEGTDLYSELQAAVKAYAETKGEYQSRLDVLKELYKDQKANIEEELTADLVGDYLFTDEKFIKNLSAEQPNIFKKIFEEIKYLVKVATSGSKEAKQLEQVKRSFEKAYRESVNLNQMETSVKYSVSNQDNVENTNNMGYDQPITTDDVDTLRSIDRKSVNDFSSEDIQKSQKWAYKFYKQLGVKSPFFRSWFGDWRSMDKTSISTLKMDLDAIPKAGNTVNKDTNMKISWGRDVFNESKLNAPKTRKTDMSIIASNISNIVENAILLDTVVSNKPSKRKLDGTSWMHSFYAAVEVDKRVILTKLFVEEAFSEKQNTSYTRAYSLKYIKEIVEIDNSVLVQKDGLTDSHSTISINSVSDLYHFVKTYDSEFSGKSVNPELLNDDGTPKVLYHGTNKEFSEFKSKNNEYWFSESIDYAESMMEEKKGDRIVKSYLNIRNPYKVTVPMNEFADPIYEKNIISYAKNNGYDGVIIENDTDVDWQKERFYVVFDSSQIKSAETNIGTFDNSNSNISMSLSDTSEDIAPVGNYNVYGKDIAFEAPTAEDIATSQDGRTFEFETNKKEELPHDGGVTVNSSLATSTSSSFDSSVPQSSENVATSEENNSNYAPNPEKFGKPITTVKERNAAKLENLKVQLEKKQKLAEESKIDRNNQIASEQEKIDKLKTEKENALKRFNDAIYKLEREYAAKKDVNTQAAEKIQRQIIEKQNARDKSQPEYDIKINKALAEIERLKRMRDNEQADAEKSINDMKARIDKMQSDEFKVAEQRTTKHQEHRELMRGLMGDTSKWQDKKMGIQYSVNTFKRNLRDIVRDEHGRKDIARADAIYEELQGKYNHNEAILNRESNAIKKPFADMKINKYEDAYIQMLGEYRGNPDTTIRSDEMTEYYEKYKDKIDTVKVDKVIEMARRTYDNLFFKVNEALVEQGFKPIEYRKGYFPHFTEHQGKLAKLLNWKVQDNTIPTDIAGLTEMYQPERSWQSFDKHRTGDSTDFSFTKGLDTYVKGALDWIYHIDDIQKLRAFENEIRYQHSPQGVQDKIEEIMSNESFDTDEAQKQIDLVYENARNPLNNFVQELRRRANNLAGKKDTYDREMEGATNRHVYSVMTNVSNRISANMVAGSISSALTNFIPITQSWGEVSPRTTLKAMKDTVKSIIRDDGMIDKSDFMTNRLKSADNLNKSGWDKVGEVVGGMMEAVDYFTTQTVWRSKYIENVQKGMSEDAAIKNADDFAEGLMAGRSRGNMPTVFNAKNPVTKLLSAFQLEVANQYGYLFKDLPENVGKEAKDKLVKSYLSIFVGAYAYNALYSNLTGRDAALDPIRIIQDFLKDLFGDDDDEEGDAFKAVGGLMKNVAQEVPFVGGLLDGGRVPISSALPFDGSFSEFTTAIEEGNKDKLLKEMLNPVMYIGFPLGGGQIKKTYQGMKMFDDDLPIAGSYTDSGNLRFAVPDTAASKVQAALFGQWANENAQDYIDNSRQTLKSNQIQELADLDLPMKEYWEYRDGLKDQKTLEDKFDYIAGLDLPVSKKNIMINNIVQREEEVDMSNYDDFSGYEEFDFYFNNQDKYEFLQKNNVSYEEYMKNEDSKSAYNWAYKNPDKYMISQVISEDVVKYRSYMNDIKGLTGDKDKNGKTISGSRKDKVTNYINDLNIDYGAKMLLFKMEYPSDDTYNADIVNYLNEREDVTYQDMVTILKELGFTVSSDGTVSW